MHMCITIQIGSSLPDLFTTSQSPSHSGLCQFKITLFTPLQWAHQTLSSFDNPPASKSRSEAQDQNGTCKSSVNQSVGPVTVAHICNPTTWETEKGGLPFKSSLGKKLAKPYLKEQTGHSGVCLEYYLQRRQRWEDQGMRLAWAREWDLIWKLTKE
jgi:hypothetical protein